MNRRILGIDLGTTNTCVAHVRNKVPTVVPSDLGRLVLPSVISLNERGSIVVGNIARERMVAHPETTIYGHKRLIGRPFNSPFVRHFSDRFKYRIVEDSDGMAAVRIGERVLTLPEISSLLLSHVRTVAEQFLGGPADDVVISVPAYYNDNQRAAVKKAGKLAGLSVGRIVSEPTAAALAYGFNRRFDQRILVFDLGGGTFDVSVLDIRGNVFEVIASGGDTFLGGVDFDDRIIQYLLKEFKKEHKIDLSEDPEVMQRITGASEAAKMDLSLLQNLSVHLPYVTTRKGIPLELKIPFSRDLLEKLTADLIDRTFRICDEVLDAKGILRREIDEIILVGGQTRMPVLQRRIEEHFGKAARKGVHPEECVALGAALLADSLHSLDAVALIDVLSMPIGIAEPDGSFRIIMDRNVRLPCEKEVLIPEIKTESEEIEIDVFQGDSNSIIDNEYLGGLRLPRKGGNLKFRLSEEGILQVLVDVPGSRSQVLKLATRKTPSSLLRAMDNEERKKPMEKKSAEADADNSVQGGFMSLIRRWLDRNK